MKKSRFQHPVIRRLNHLWQAALMYVFTGIFWMLPVDAASALGGWIGRTIGFRLGVSRRARKNLDYIFPDLPASDKTRIIIEMWDNMGRTTAEASHLKKLREAKYCVVEGIEHMHKARSDNRPIMLLSGHFANWEMGSVMSGAQGFPIAVVYRRPNNPHIDKLVRWLRHAVNEDMFGKGTEGARGVLKRLRNGQAVGLLVDQKMNEGVSLPFLGKPAMTATAPAEMALITNAVMIPIELIRLNGARFKMLIHPPFEPDTALSRPEQILDLTRRMNDFMSHHIRNYPGQWLWLHRRWTFE